MSFRYTPYTLLLLAIAAVLAALAFYAFKRRGTPGATAFALLMLAACEWKLTYALELGAAGLAAKVFWAKAGYLGVVAMPPAWMVFVLRYTGLEERWLTHRNLALLSVVPLLTLALVWTNGAHGLVWSSVGLGSSDAFSTLEKEPGAWFWAHASYSYLLLLLGTALLFSRIVRSSPLYRKQGVALLVGALLPWIANAAYLSGLSPFTHVNTTAVAFPLTGALFAWALFRLRLLDLVPVARDVLVEGMGDGAIVLDAKDRVVDLNPAAQRILRLPATEAIGQSVVRIVPDRVALLLGRLRGAMEAREEVAFGEGAGRHFELALSALDDGSGRQAGRLLLLRDVTERKVLEERLGHQAFHDPLTGLPNRAMFSDRLAHALALGDRRGKTTAVLFVDLNNFKVVNDSLGHEIGDRLLVAVGERLGGCLRPQDILARFGGDEFTIMIDDVENPADAVRVAERIMDAHREPFGLGGQEFVVKPSIGIALGNARTASPEDLLRDADTAMYQAKGKEGLGGYRMFEPVMYEQALRRLKLENDLRKAIERDELRVYYQPMFSLKVARIVAMEALLRWEHPERGAMLPAEFIPLAEETGLIVPVGRWVLEEACRQAREWQEWFPSDPPLMMSVNFSLRQFQDPGLAGDVARILRETGLVPNNLALEITESVAMHGVDSTVATLEKLKSLGVWLVIDDFGTGNSSLFYLTSRFKMDHLKIDGSFVREFLDDSDNSAIIPGLIDFAHAVGLRVIAEGVETAEQLRRLKEAGCELVRGNHIAKPLTSAAASELLAREPSPMAAGRKR